MKLPKFFLTKICQPGFILDQSTWVYFRSVNLGVF